VKNQCRLFITPPLLIAAGGFFFYFFLKFFLQYACMGSGHLPGVSGNYFFSTMANFFICSVKYKPFCKMQHFAWIYFSLEGFLLTSLSTSPHCLMKC